MAPGTSAVQEQMSRHRKVELKLRCSLGAVAFRSLGRGARHSPSYSSASGHEPALMAATSWVIWRRCNSSCSSHYRTDAVRAQLAGISPTECHASVIFRPPSSTVEGWAAHLSLPVSGSFPAGPMAAIRIASWRSDPPVEPCGFRGEPRQSVTPCDLSRSWNGIAGDRIGNRAM